MSYQDTISRVLGGHTATSALEEQEQLGRDHNRGPRFNFYDYSSYATTPNSPMQIEGWAGETYDEDALRTFLSDKEARDSWQRTLDNIEAALKQPALNPSERTRLEQMRDRLSQRGAEAMLAGGQGRNPLEWAMQQLMKLPETVAYGYTQSVEMLKGNTPEDWSLSTWGKDLAAIWTSDRERLARRYGEEGSGIAGAEGHFAGSDVLTATGWDTEDMGWLEGTGRFVASTAFDVFFDPQTYVTFGGAAAGSTARGAGTKAAIDTVVNHVAAQRLAAAGVRGAVDDVVGRGGRVLTGTSAYRQVDAIFDRVLPDLVDDATRTWAATDSVATGILNQRSLGIITDAEMQVALGIRATQAGARREILETAMTGATAAARNEVAPRVIVPSVARDFAKVDPEFQALRREGFADLLPAYTLGGIRVGTIGGKYGVMVPGTQGLGRKITTVMLGKPLGIRGRTAMFPKLATMFEQASKRVASFAGRLSNDSLLKRIITNPKIVDAAGVPIGWRVLDGKFSLSDITHWGNDLIHGIDLRLTNLETVLPDDLAAGVYRDVFDLIETSMAVTGGVAHLTPALARTALGKEMGGNAAIHGAATEFANQVVKTMHSIWEQLKVYKDKDLGEIGNYIPHVLAQDARKWVRILANAPERVVSRGGDRGAGILEKLQNAFSEVVDASSPGSAAPLRTREIGVGGVTVFGARGADDVILLQDRRLLEAGGELTRTVFGQATKLNDEIMRALREFAHDHPGVLPSAVLKDGATFFELDPARILDGYINGMLNTIKTYKAVDVFQRLGLIKRRTLLDGFDVDVNEAVNTILNRWWDKMDVRGRTMHHTLISLILDAEKGNRTLGPLQKVKIGVDEIEVPSLVAAHPEFREHIAELRAGLRRAEKNKREFAREVDIKIRQLKREGWTQVMAEALAGGADRKVLAEARRLLRMKTETKRQLAEAINEATTEFSARLGPEGVERLRLSTDALLREIETSVAAAKDDILRKYASILREAMREIDPSYATQAASPFTNAQLTTLVQTLDRIAIEQHEEYAATLTARIAAQSEWMEANGVPHFSESGERTAARLDLDNMQAELEILQAMKNEDTAAVQMMMEQQAMEMEGNFARRAMDEILADIEAFQNAGHLAPRAGAEMEATIEAGKLPWDVKWEGGNVTVLTVDGELVTKKMTAAQVRAYVTEIYHDPMWRSFHVDIGGGRMFHPFFDNEVIVSMANKVLARGGEIVSHTETAELLEDLAAQGLTAAVDAMHDARFLYSIGKQKDEYLASLTGGAKGRPKEMWPNLTEAEQKALEDQLQAVERVFVGRRKGAETDVVGARGAADVSGAAPAVRGVAEWEYRPKPVFKLDENGSIQYYEMKSGAALPVRVPNAAIMPQPIPKWRIWREHYLTAYRTWEANLLEHADDAAAPGARLLQGDPLLQAVRQNDWPTVRRVLARLDDSVIDSWTERLHNAGVMPPHLRIVRHVDTRYDLSYLAVETTDVIMPTIQAPEFEALVASVRATKGGAVVPDLGEIEAALLSHPQIRGLVDQYVALEDAVRVHRQVGRKVVRDAQAAERALESFETVATQAQAALALSLRDSTIKGRATLRRFLYAADKSGRWVLTPEAKALRAVLGDPEFMRLHNQAEYLAVIGELERGKAGRAVVDAVRGAHKFQESAVPLYSGKRAARSASKVANDLTRMLTDEEMARHGVQRETIEMMREFVNLVDGLRRYLPRAGGPEEALGQTRNTFGRETPALLADLAAARKLGKELKDRTITVRTPKGKIVERPALYGSAADEIDEVLDVTKSFDGVSRITRSNAGQGMVSFGVRGIEGGPLGNMVGSPEVVQFFANWIDVTSAIFNPLAMDGIRTAAIRFEQYWKTVNTVGRPIPFNIRNMMGGLWNNMVAGLHPLDPLYWKVARALHDVEHGRRALGLSTKDAIDTIKDARLRAAFHAAQTEEAVLDSFHAIELRRMLRGVKPISFRKGSREGLVQAVNPVSPGFAPVRAGAAIMEDVENLLRMSLFVKHYDQALPESAHAAAAWVRAVHFDYSDLTNLEVKIKRFVPFYIWAKRNMELQLRVLVERPELVARYWKLQRNLQENFGGDTEAYDGFPTPGYWGDMAAGTDIFRRQDSPYWMRMFLDPDLPVADLWAFPALGGGNGESSIAWAINQLGPGFDVATALLGGQYDDPGYTAQAPMPLEFAARVFGAVQPFWEMGEPNYDGGMKVHPAMAQMFDSLFPWWRNLVEPLTIPRDTRRAQRMGFTPEDTGIDERLLALLFEQAKGLGVQWQTPRDVPGPLYDIGTQVDRIIDQVKSRGEHLTPQELKQQEWQQTIDAAYNGG